MMNKKAVPPLSFFRFRSPRGFNVVEFAASALVVILVGIVAVDATLLTFGSLVNDRACRDAVRAASSSTNYAQALSAVEKTLSVRATGGHFISHPKLVNFDYHTFEGEPPATEVPYVSATTNVIVKLPAARLIFERMQNEDGVLFSQTYTFPLTETATSLPGHSWAVSKPSFSTKVLNP